MTDAFAPSGIDGTEGTDVADGSHELLSRLRIIEEQPLPTRADAYAALHDELAVRLESAPPR
ncbi:hypothetical protein [Microbacterium sp. CJ88]|uniref:hypothetical protein n=1 Tax=Microbacterium sp. CJ88 TaxID=3445672 RepID=UPI003F65AB86